MHGSQQMSQLVGGHDDAREAGRVLHQSHRVDLPMVVADAAAASHVGVASRHLVAGASAVSARAHVTLGDHHGSVISGKTFSPLNMYLPMEASAPTASKASLLTMCCSRYGVASLLLLMTMPATLMVIGRLV